MNFPAKPAEPAEAPSQLAEALGAAALYTGRNQFDYLEEVADEATLRGLNPNHHLLRQLPVRGVTGSAHSTLAPFRSKRLEKTEMIGFQASARGGVVHTLRQGVCTGTSPGMNAASRASRYSSLPPDDHRCVVSNPPSPVQS